MKKRTKIDTANLVLILDMKPLWNLRLDEGRGGARAGSADFRSGHEWTLRPNGLEEGQLRPL